MFALPRLDMKATVRLVALLLLVVAAIVLLSMCGEGVCTTCVEALWHGSVRSGALRTVVMAVAAAMGAVAVPLVAASLENRSRARTLPVVPLLRVANLRI